MKKLLLSFLLLSTVASFAQSFIGMHSDNYSGINGILYNPGAIADSRTKSEFNLISVSDILATDYTNLTRENISNIIDGIDINTAQRFPSNKNKILINLEVLGPSTMFSLSKKSSMALTSRIRIVGNYNNINGDAIEAINNGFDNDFTFSQNNLDVTTHAWAELGLTYGRVFHVNSTSLFKGGVSLKYLAGGGFVQASSNSLDGNYNETNSKASLIGDLSYASSMDEDSDSEDFFNSISPGFGADIGFVYEFRTNASIAPSNGNNPRGFNQYKFKIGVSILDIGSITYPGIESNTFTVNAEIDNSELEDDLIQAIEDNSTTTKTVEDIKVSLPTSLHVNLDYRITNRVYLNLDMNRGLVKEDKFFNNNRLNLMTLTPRYETRILGVYLPISQSVLGKTAIGAGIRFGPITIGSGTILSNLMGKNAHTANAFAGVKLPINHKRKV